MRERKKPEPEKQEREKKYPHQKSEKPGPRPRESGRKPEAEPRLGDLQASGDRKDIIVRKIKILAVTMREWGIARRHEGH